MYVLLPLWPQLLHPHRVLYRCVCALLVLLVLVQGALLIAVRNHYSVDVVAAVILCPLVWRLFYHEFGDDVNPAHFLREYRAAKRRGDKHAVAQFEGMTAEELCAFRDGKGAAISFVAMIVLFVLLLGVNMMFFVSVSFNGKVHVP